MSADSVSTHPPPLRSATTKGAKRRRPVRSAARPARRAFSASGHRAPRRWQIQRGDDGISRVCYISGGAHSFSDPVACVHPPLLPHCISFLPFLLSLKLTPFLTQVWLLCVSVHWLDELDCGCSQVEAFVYCAHRRQTHLAQTPPSLQAEVLPK